MAADQHRTGSYAPDQGGVPADARDRLALQHERFGGINWGAAFFGWLAANGLAVLLTAIVSAAGVAVGLTSGGLPADRQGVEDAAAGDAAATIGLAGGLALIAVLAVAYFAGGYVAGRMSRFDGARQGLGVWVIGLVVVVLLAVAGTVFGARYNVLSRLDLPRIPVDEGTASTGAIVALVAVLVVTALAALLGGTVGQRYHRRVDRAAFTG